MIDNKTLFEFMGTEKEYKDFLQESRFDYEDENTYIIFELYRYTDGDGAPAFLSGDFYDVLKQPADVLQAVVLSYDGCGCVDENGTSCDVISILLDM